MLKENITVKNPSGLHLRPAGILCKEAMKFKSRITLGAEGSYANAKSVLSVLGAGVKCDDVVELVCEGEDEAEAMDKIKDLIENGLTE